MDIFVKSVTGSWTFHLERNSTVRDLKFQIQKREGYPIEQQLLSLWLMGKQLDRDNMYLSDYNIHNGSIIHFRVRLRSPKTNPSQITIKMVDGTQTTYNIDVNADDTIQTVKQKVFDQTTCTIPVDNQILFWNGSILINEHTLGGSLIPDKACLHLKVRFKQVNVSIVLLNNEQFELSINQSQTINDLKYLMQKQYGIPEKDQIYNDVQINELLDEPLTCLSDGQRINLTFPICEMYQKDIDIYYTNTTEKMIKYVQQKFMSEGALLDKVLKDTETIIKTASSLNALRNIKSKQLPKLEYGGHKVLKLFKLDIAKLKDESVLFHSKQVIKCVEINDDLKKKLCFLKDELVVNSKHNISYIETKQRMKALEKFCNKNYYKVLCDFIADKNVKTLNDKVAEMEKLYHKHLQEMQHQEEFKRMIIEKMREFENNFHKWNSGRSIEWILLIENGYFDYKEFQRFIGKLKAIGINGTQLKDLNNELLLNMIELKDKKHQYIIRKHINRIIQQYENDNDQSMCGLCIENQINTVIIPCGHQYYCSSCIENYQPDSCPICRNEIDQIIRTFLSGFSK